MINSGTVCWPEQTHFSKIEGDDDLQVFDSYIPNQQKIAPGSSYTFEVVCIAPKRVGQANVVFGLKSDDNKFGQEISCAHNIVDDDGEKQLSESLIQLMEKDKSVDEEVKMVA